MPSRSSAPSLLLLAATTLLYTGCKPNSGLDAPKPTTTATDDTPADSSADTSTIDPAEANLAPAGNTQVLSASQAADPQQSYESYNTDDNPYPNSPSAEPVATATQPPPPIPDYDQPPAPEPNTLWTPGYWAYASNGYYWVPGAWVAPPYYGALWTPPYWGYTGGRYRLHRGYWGNHIGFYGGVDYGFGYVGIGYFGGYWQGRDFYYNRAVTNVGPRVITVYRRPVVVNNVHYAPQPHNRVSFNGGPGGISVRPRPTELAAMRETHSAPRPEQVQLRQQAIHNPQQAFAANHGRPAMPTITRTVSSPSHIAEPPQQRNDQAEHNAPGPMQPHPSIDAKQAAQQRDYTLAQRNADAQRNAQAEQQRNAAMMNQRSQAATQSQAAHNPPPVQPTVHRSEPMQMAPQQPHPQPQQPRSEPQQPRVIENRPTPQPRPQPESHPDPRPNDSHPR